MYRISQARSFKKSYKRIIKSGSKNVAKEAAQVINKIACGKSLDVKHKDHGLSGVYGGNRECHIKPDLLLIYKLEKETGILFLLDIGSHSDLFG